MLPDEFVAYLLVIFSKQYFYGFFRTLHQGGIRKQNTDLNNISWLQL